MKTLSLLLTQQDIDFLTKSPIHFEEGNFADYMWGGKELYRLKGISANGTHKAVAESWEVSGHPKYPSKVKLPSGDTHALMQLLENDALAEQILGKEVVQNFSNDFPALVKFFDVQKHMSVQVHPSDHVARQWGERDPGKGEVFVVLEVYKGGESAVYMGLKEGVTKSHFARALEAGENLLDLMHKVYVKPGEVYVLPSGVVHCWTGGTMAVEITEPSDLTYRLYDFGRGRPMHLDRGLASVNFEIQNGPDLENVARTVWQRTATRGLEQVATDNRLKIERVHLGQDVGSVDVVTNQAFDVLMGIEGSLELASDTGDWQTTLRKGYSVLIPAGAGDYTIRNLAGVHDSQALRITTKI